MSLVNRIRIGHRAKRDARVGKYQADDQVVALTGRRPPWDIEAYPDQAFLAESLQLESRLAEYEDPGFGLDDPPRESAPAAILVIGGVFFFAVAALASIQLMAILGLAPGHRVVLGIALEALLILITSGVKQVVDGTTRGWSAAGILAVYAAFLTSAALLRVSDVAVPESGAVATDWAAAILLLLAVAGPSWLAETCFRSLMDSAHRRRQGRLAKRELSTDRLRVQWARQELAVLGREQRDLDQTQAQLKAIYDTTFYQRLAANGPSGNGAKAPKEKDLS